MHTVTGPGIDEIRVRDGEGAATSRALTAAEAGRLPDASYYVRDDDGVVRARVDRVGGITVVRAGRDLAAPDRGAEDGGEDPLRSPVPSSTRRPESSGGGTRTKEEPEVAEQKQKTRAKSRSSAKRSSTSARSSAKAATAKTPAATTTTAAEVAAGGDLYKELMSQVRAAIQGVQEKPNASHTYTRLLTKAGKAFAYVFPPRKDGVALKIPKQLLAVERELPEGHGFKTTGWGLTRTVKNASEAAPVAKALAVAAKAVEAK